VEPGELGLALARPEELKGGDPARNAGFVDGVLSGETGPHRDIALLNAAAVLVLAGQAGDLADGLAQGRESIDSGRAKLCLDRLVSLSRSQAAATGEGAARQP